MNEIEMIKLRLIPWIQRNKLKIFGVGIVAWLGSWGLDSSGFHDIAFFLKVFIQYPSMVLIGIGIADMLWLKHKYRERK